MRENYFWNHRPFTIVSGGYYREREREGEGKREVKSIISNSNKLQAAPSVFAEHSNLKIIKLSLIFHEKACARYSSKGCIMEMIKLHLQTQKYANHFPFS